MPRPINEPCAKCVREGTPCQDHLGNTYDHEALKKFGRKGDELAQDERDQLDQSLVIYALNRMLALNRDNGNKAEGKPASRIYKSRNETSARMLSNRCPATRGTFKCMRPEGHEAQGYDHKF